MRVIRGFPEQPSGPIALTIGNFDGVHLGHQAMLKKLVHAARERGLAACIMTFEPHPREFFAPDQAPTRLTSLREKLELLAGLGLDRVYVCHFNRAFSRISAEDFIAALHERLDTRWLLVGDDFRFGARRAGDYGMLQEASRRLGFELCAMESVTLRGKRVSSTAVREALAEGDLAHAAELLGRPYSISGRVLHGDKLGRTLGFPTANVQMKHNRPPLCGVFAVRLYGLDSRALPGVASLGVRPTVAHLGRPTLEVHLFDFSADIYGRLVRVEFRQKLRDEEKFDDLETLRRHIAQDAEDALKYFSQPQT